MTASSEFQARYLDILKTSPYLASVIRPGRKVADIQYYAYNGRIGTDAVPLAVNVPQFQDIVTQSDSDFILTFLSACVQEVANGAMAYNDNVALQIQDLSTGKLFFNVPTAMALVTGAGGFPYVLPAPRVLAPNTAVQLTATNRDTIVNAGAGPVGLFYALHGTRVFYE